MTSYDYDVHINEYTQRAEPKFSLLERLHSVLIDSSEALLAQLPPVAVTLTKSCESHTYRSSSSTSSTSSFSHEEEEQCVSFLSNWGEIQSCVFPLPSSDISSTVGSKGKGNSVSVPPWSVTILRGNNCSKVVFNTKDSIKDVEPANYQHADIVNDVVFAPFHSIQEPFPSRVTRSPSSAHSAVVVADGTIVPHQRHHGLSLVFLSHPCCCCFYYH